MMDLGIIQVSRKMADDNEVNVVIPHFDMTELVEITYNSQKYVISLLVIYLPGLVPYSSNKVVPYKYNVTMIEDGKEIVIPSIINIGDVSGVTRRSCVFAIVPPKRVENSLVGKKTQVEDIIVRS